MPSRTGRSSAGSLYSILLVNATKWGRKAKDYVIKSFATDSSLGACLVSEHHLPSQDVGQLQDWAAKNGLRALHTPAKDIGGEGVLVGTAIILRRDLEFSDLWTDARLARLPLPKDQDWVPVRVRLKGIELVLISLYMVNSIGLQQPNLDRLAGLAHFLDTVRLPFIIGADWNMQPHELAQAPWIRGIGGTIYCPEGLVSTCTSGIGRVLDYFVIHNSLSGLLLGMSPDLRCPIRPHIPLKLYLPWRPRSMRARMLVVPRPIPLVAGPDLPDAWQSACSEAADSLAQEHLGVRGHALPVLSRSAVYSTFAQDSLQITKDYSVWSLACENFLITRAGLAGQVIAAHSRGRGQFPKFIIGPMVAKRVPEALPSSKAASLSSALAARLREYKLLRARGTGLNQRMMLVAVIVTLSSDLTATGLWSAGPPCWAAQLSRLSSQGLPELHALVTSAEAEAATLLQRDSAAATAGFQQWVRRHAASPGQGPLHKWAARVNSLPPLRTSAIDGASLIDTVLDMSALRQREWMRLWGRPSAQCPVSTIAAIRLRALEDDPPEKCSLRQLDRALAQFNPRTTVGLDHWNLQHLKSLPVAARAALCPIIDSVRSELVLPLQTMGTCIHMLPKPKEGEERPIGLLSTLFRIVSRLDRQEFVQPWESGLHRHWDHAIAGSSALRSAFGRLIRSECAHLLKESFGLILWDLTKFYDSIDWSALISNALSLGFSPRVLVISAIAHLSPRFLEAEQAWSEGDVPLASIVQGCVHANSMSRAFLYPVLDRAHAVYGLAAPEQFVDDLSQAMEGTIVQVTTCLGESAIALAEDLSDLGVQISVKSGILGSSGLIVKKLTAMLRSAGVHLASLSTGRDLGLDTTAGRRRSMKVAKGRQVKAKARNAKVSRLSRFAKASKKLFSTGTYAQFTWGHQAMGLSPSSLKALRGMSLAALSLGSARLCTTTAIALSYGVASDPALRQRVELVSHWLQHWHAATPHARQRISRAWPRSLSRLLHKSTRWLHVRGPIAAVQSTLLDVGWKPAGPVSWFDPEGQEWAYDGTLNGLAAFQAHLRESISLFLWAQASVYEHGKGLEKGPDLAVPTALYSHYGRTGRFAERALLVLVCSAGTWPNQRLLQSGLAQSGACPRCGQEESLLHRYWYCPANGTSDHPDIVSSQHLVRRARREAGQFPALWLRALPPSEWSRPQAGLLPEGFVRSITLLPMPEDELRHVFLDGSGGAHSSDPRLRRCGFAAVMVDSMGPANTMAQVTYGALGGLPQTVPRSELTAALAALRAFSGPLILYSDCDYFVKGVGKSSHWHLTCSNNDLWAQFVPLWSARRGEVRVLKVKAHAQAHHLQAGLITVPELRGNYLADGVAGLAASSHSIPEADVQQVAHVDALARSLARRFVAIAGICSREERRPARVEPKLPAARTAPLTQRARDSSHAWDKRGMAWHCMTCGISVPQKRFSEFLASEPPCTPQPARHPSGSAPTRLTGSIVHGGVPLHSSHTLWSKRGIVWCTSCGAYAAGSVRTLRRNCRRYTTQSSEGYLSRLRRGLTPQSHISWLEEEA